MLDLLTRLFAFVCGQDAAHTWSPGGLSLPVCQRCLGLYSAILMAALYHLVFRPSPAKTWLWLHGAFLLMMLPFGLHLLPQGPFVRTWTGALFGFGVVAYLWLPLRRSVTPRRLWPWSYAAVVSSVLIIIPIYGSSGDIAASFGLTTVACGGAAALAFLMLRNAACALAGIVRASGFRKSAVQ